MTTNFVLEIWIDLDLTQQDSDMHCVSRCNFLLALASCLQQRQHGIARRLFLQTSHAFTTGSYCPSIPRIQSFTAGESCRHSRKRFPEDSVPSGVRARRHSRVICAVGDDTRTARETALAGCRTASMAHRHKLFLTTASFNGRLTERRRQVLYMSWDCREDVGCRVCSGASEQCS